MLRGYYDSRFLPNTVEDTPADILVLDDNVALITLEAPIFGTVITQPFIAQTFSVVLETLYSKL